MGGRQRTTLFSEKGRREEEKSTPKKAQGKEKEK